MIWMKKEHVQNYEIWTASYRPSCIQFVTARCYAEQSAVMPQYIVCHSVCPSVCNVQVPYHDHIGWNSSKIISRPIGPNSLRRPLWLTLTWAIWCTFIRSITTTVINNFGKSSRGRSHGLPKFFRASTDRAHRAVIFAIEGLSCLIYLDHWHSKTATADECVNK